MPMRQNFVHSSLRLFQAAALVIALIAGGIAPQRVYAHAPRSEALQSILDYPVASDDGVYMITSTTYEWVDRSGSSEELIQAALANSDHPLTEGAYDGSVAIIELGNKVPYYGTIYEAIEIYGNGNIAFLSGLDVDYVGYTYRPGFDRSKSAAIIPVGGQKYIDTSVSKIYYKKLSSREWVIQFVNLLDAAAPDQPSTFEVKIEDSGKITIQYLQTGGSTGLMGLTSPAAVQQNRAGNHIRGVYHPGSATHPNETAYAFVPMFTPDSPFKSYRYKLEKNAGLTSFTRKISQNDFDPSGSGTGERRVSRKPANGTVELLSDGTFNYQPDPGFVGVDKFTYIYTRSDGRWMEADVYITVTDSSQTEGRITTTEVSIWETGCTIGKVNGYHPAGEPFRYAISPKTIDIGGYPIPIPGGAIPVYFNSALGEFIICIVEDLFELGADAVIYDGYIETKTFTPSRTQSLTAHITTGTSVSGDGLYTAAGAVYTAGTLPWDELSEIPEAVDLASTLEPGEDFPDMPFDDTVFEVPIGFPFPYFEVNFDKIYPNTNGYIGFSDNPENVWDSPAPLPRFDMGSAIHAFTTEGFVNSNKLSGNTYPETHIYYHTFYDDAGKTQPNRFVIQYVDFVNVDAKNQPSTFQVVLYPNGRIEVRYKSISGRPYFAGLEYDPIYSEHDGDLPGSYGLNFPIWEIQDNLVVEYNYAPSYQVEAGYELIVDAAGGVRANDFSLTPNQTGEVTLSVKEKPRHGTVTLNQDGSFAYTPDAGYVGRDTFVYTATLNSNNFPSDGLVIIDVIDPVSQPPVITAVNGSRVVDEGTPVSLTVVATDPDGDPLKYSYRAAGGAVLPGAVMDETTGVFSWPNPTPGTYTITFRAYKANKPYKYDEETVTLTVNDVNQPPVILSVDGAKTVDEGQTVSLTVVANDPDGDELVYQVTGAPGGTINPQTGVFTWETGEADDGVYSLTFRVSEVGNPGFYDEETITLTVNEVNQPPVIDTASLPASGEWIRAGAPMAFTARATDNDVIGGVPDTLTFSLVNPPDGAAIDPQTGKFSWTPSIDQAGTHTITVQVTDGGGLAAEASFDWTVNQPPVFQNMTLLYNLRAGEQVAFQVTAADPDGGPDPLTLKAAGLPEGAQFNAATGKFTWTPGKKQAASYTIRFTASDGLDEVEVNVKINVQAAAVEPFRLFVPQVHRGP
ncbi:MAG: tandem-95 repeat protein [Chloroflexi bacterium]|nr:tandem-95 repeat protein [Chloroflexota bacterium]